MGDPNKNSGTWKSFLDADLKAPPQISDSESDYESKSKANTPDREELEASYLFNSRALNKYAETYRLETFEQNYLMIFNQVNIDGYLPREGTEKDVEALTNTFSAFGFEIHEHKDLTKDQIMEELKVLKEKDFTHYGCIAVAVLTHGTHGGLLRAKDMQYSETEIIKHFKTQQNPSLLTKPKILIIQACRGTRPIKGVLVQKLAMIVHKDLDEHDESYTLPLESDILVLHSSYPGHPSHRVNLHGSWFVKVLCEEIAARSPKMDLESIITYVKRKVAIDMSHEVFNKRTGETAINKQMPTQMSTLIRKLYLRHFEDITCVDNDLVETVEPQAAVPITPMLVKFGPCSCFLDHFAYLRQCLRYIVDDNPEDRTAQNYLELCDTFDDGDQFNSAKEKMATLISEYLETTAQHFEFYKYLYMYQSRT